MSRRLPLLVAFLASAPALFSPSAAEAQVKTFTVDRLFMAGAPDDGVGIWRPEMGKETRFFGQFGLGLAINPLRSDNFVDDQNKEDTLQGNPLTSQLISYFNAGAQIYGRGTLQVSFPLALFQSGNPTSNTETDPNLSLKQAVSLKPVAPMDLRLEARFLVFRNEPKTFSLGLLGAAYVPTGNKYSFAGDGKPGALFGVAAEYKFQRYIFDLNTAFRVRPFANLNELNISHEITYGLAGYVPLQDGQYRVGAEIFGAFGVKPGNTLADKAKTKDRRYNGSNAGDLDTSPLEWNINGRAFFTKKKQAYVGLSLGSRLNGGYSPDFRAVALVGGFFSIVDKDPSSPGFIYVEDNADTDKDGYPDNIDMCPNDPEDGKGANPSDGCPQLPDRDNDGIPDVSDKCPDQAEDMDGTDDRDGCPEDDADKDGIPDAQDQCPKEPGEVATDETAKNGCPHYIRRITGSAEIQIMKQVEFAFDSAAILEVSFPILDEVVRLLQVNTEIKLVSVEGHTDNRGTDEYNDRLSRARASSIVEYIVKKGIARTRLTSSGFGSKKPLMSNETDQGRQKNRRVEFHIKSQTIEGR
jgi:OmpA-OmpF porin, OOP family